jgi:hypothetical protein
VLCALCGSGFSQDREAFTITHWQLDVQIMPNDGALSASGRVTLRNDSLVPEDQAVLQISSTLGWQSVEINGRPASFQATEIKSDYDHSGAMREIVVKLPRPIAPKTSIDLDVSYSGTVPLDARRLTEAMGARIPLDVGEASDWDRVSPEITLLRGAGYVAWYPIAIEPELLATPEQYFDRLAAWRERHAGSVLSTDICVQAVMPAGFTIVASGSPREVTSSSTHAKCAGFDFHLATDPAPIVAAGLFGIAERKDATAYYLGSRPAALDLLAAFEQSEQKLATWFTPRRRSYIVQLPGQKIAAFESGTLLATPFDPSDKLLLETNSARQIAHASFYSPRPWMDEGVAQFAQALVQEQSGGRKRALEFMNTRVPLLLHEEALATRQEAGRGQPLVYTDNDVVLKLKSMFVWWMLRDLVGDDALQRALAAYRVLDDKEPSYVQRLLERESHQDLEWFFDDWIYRDRGLPEFKVAEVYVRPTLQNTYTVVVTVQNEGGPEARVPVIVHTAEGDKMESVRVAGHEKGVARITVPAVPTGVTVNDGSVPELDRSNNDAKVELPKQ